VKSLLGALFTVGLGYLLKKYDNRTKLQFSLCCSNNYNNTEQTLRTKTSPSDYQLDITNVGKKPVLLKNVRLSFNDEIITDIIFIDTIKILPFEQHEYTLMEQEYKALLFYCRKKNICKCDIFAYDSSDKKIKGKLDLWLLSLQVGRTVRLS
jgi:hypothetical protein